MGYKNKFLGFKSFLHNLAFGDIRLLAAAFIFITASWAFLGIADMVNEGTTKNFDEWVLKSLRNAQDNEIPRGPEWLPESVRDITALGGGMVLTLVTLAVVGFLVLQKQYKIMVLLLVAVLGGTLLSVILKETFARQRPNVVLHLMTENSLSFPSGHSMMSMVTYLSLGSLLARIQKARKLRVYIISLALFLSFIIGLSRIYLGVHYPTDVIAGWSVGLAWATLVWFAAWYIQNRASSSSRASSGAK